MQTNIIPLLIAIKNGDEDTVQELLKQGSDINAKEDKKGYTPLMVASAVGNAAIVQLLLEWGADVGVTNNRGQTALDICNDPDIIEMLESNPEAVDEEEEPYIEEDNSEYDEDSEGYEESEDYEGSEDSEDYEDSENGLFLNFPVDEKGQIKIDIESSAERSLTIGLIVFIFILFLPFLLYWNVGRFDNFQLVIFVIGFVGTAFFAFFRSRVDDYFLADLNSRTLFYHTKNRLFRQAGFDEILGISVEGIMKRQSFKGVSQYWWEYMIMLVIDTGEKYRISDSYQIEYYEMNRCAENLAEKMGVPFIPGEPEKIVSVVPDDSNGTQIKLVDKPGASFWLVVGIIIFGFSIGLFFCALGSF
ncbi:ankyrin repeat domain-containing protein [Candidatus Riflebacteria bacterium]